jgi:hypothetical protein
LAQLHRPAYQGPYSKLSPQQLVVEAQQQAAMHNVVHELLAILAQPQAINPVTHVVHCSDNGSQPGSDTSQCNLLILRQQLP